LVDQVCDEALQLRGILDAVLGLAEDEAQEARLLAELTQQFVVVRLELGAVSVQE